MQDGHSLFSLAAYASMSKQARNRAGDSMLLTMMPGGAPDQRAAVSAVALTQQAEDGVRRERQVAAQTVDAAKDALETPGEFDRARLARYPALKWLASDDLAGRLTKLAGRADEGLLAEAVGAIEIALEAQPGAKLAKGKLAKVAPRIVEGLSKEQRAKILEQE